jgi:hypothetical protein
MGAYTSYTGFIECTSMNISYDVMGRATISYTVVHGTKGIVPFPEGTIENQVSVGGQIFRGYVANATMNQIPRTSWYETHVTFVGVTN